jgi:SAM-dependent methyltransferase
MMNPAEFANIAQAENGFWWYRGMRRIMFGLLDPIAAKRKFQCVLEAGCGTGHFALALRQRYGWPMVPLDLGWEGLEYGKSLGVSRLTQGDIQALPFRPAAFDAVVSMDVIVHFPRPSRLGAGYSAQPALPVRHGTTAFYQIAAAARRRRLRIPPDSLHLRQFVATAGGAIQIPRGGTIAGRFA